MTPGNGPSIYPDCGTYAAWNRHKAKKNTPCLQCRKAAADYARDRRHRLGESKGTWVYVPDPPVLTDDHYSI
jgi:hypothetical protein